MPLSVPQGINVSNGYIEFERTNGVAPTVAPAGKARLSLGTGGALMLSVGGGAYGEVEASGAAGDSLTLGGDVTLTRSAANVLTIPESVIIANPTAAASALIITGATSQSADAFLVRDVALAAQFRVTAAGLVQAGTGVTAAYKLEVSGGANDTVSSSLRARNTNSGTTTATTAGMTMETAASSGFVGAYHSGHSTAAFADNIVLRTDSTATAIVISAETGTQQIRFRVPTTGQILSLGTAALTLAEGANFVAGTTTGSKIGVTGGAAGEKWAFWGATPVVQPLLATGGGATADDIISVLQSLGLARQS